ncbi:MAG TPA: cytochrome c oxidase subunit II [Steroidobacteraceae bacterium]|nr:cytochrome c oxidase subunit II [Steroidobacteraceae bacterium]
MMRTTRSMLAALAALTFASMAGAQAKPGESQESGWGLLNMTQGVTDISRRIYDLHMIIFWVCVIIGIAVFGAMIVSIVRFRKSKGAVPDVKMVHNTRVEIIWTIVPVIILVGMAVPATRTLIEIEDTRNTGLTVKVTGYQWGWRYDYLDSGVFFYSRLDRESDAARQLLSGKDVTRIPNYLLNVDNPFVVPAGVKVRLLVTGADVIHAWWVPAFGMKKDAIPGFINELWFQVDEDKLGLYRGQCAELCGRDHAFMPIVADVRSKADFDAWLKAKAAEQSQAATPAEPAPAESPAATPATSDPNEPPPETATARHPAATTSLRRS